MPGTEREPKPRAAERRDAAPAGPTAAPSGGVMGLQRSVGNRAVSAMAQRDALGPQQQQQQMAARLGPAGGAPPPLQSRPVRAPGAPAAAGPLAPAQRAAPALAALEQPGYQGPSSAAAKMLRAGRDRGLKAIDGAVSEKGAAVGAVGAGAGAVVPGGLQGYENFGNYTAATMSGHGTYNTGAGANVSASGTELGMGTGALAAGVGLGMMGYGAYNMYQGDKTGDKALGNLGGRMAKSGAWMTAGGAASLGTAATGFQNLANAGTAASVLGTASMGFMVAGGAVTAARGIWKFGKAASKLMSLNDVRPATAKGSAWLARARDREKAKMKISAFKTLLGAAGIAAGSLLLASNPIGWAIGLGAAVVGGVTLMASLKNKYGQGKQDAKLKAEMEKQQAQNAPKVDQSKVPAKKKDEIAQATDEVAEVIQSNLQVGYEIKDALVAADHRGAEPVYERVSADDKAWKEGAPFPTAAQTMIRLRELQKAPTVPEFTALDAMMILSALNVDRGEAVAANGPELIQDKLSAAAAG